MLTNILPEILAILTIALMGIDNLVCLPRMSLCILVSVLLRFVWNSAILIHGLGHTFTLAIVDRQISSFNLDNILEHRKLRDVFKSLIPGNSIFIPWQRLLLEI